MGTAESLCCGTPVAGFRAGAPEQIALPAFSRFVQWGDVQQLLDTVEELLKSTGNDTPIAECSAQVYAQNRMAEGYITLYVR